MEWVCTGVQQPASGARPLALHSSLRKTPSWWAVTFMCNAQVAFAVCTALNIGPRAIQHHRWYHTKFKGEYPAKRKALIPFLL